MAITLEIDLGNTRSKWRLRERGQKLSCGVCATAEFPNQEVLQLQGVQRICLASVLDQQISQRIVQLLKEQFKLTVECAVTSAQQSAVKIGYKVPETMGVDRWLAVLAAYHQREFSAAGVMVVSCGTAMTLDFVRADGLHEGGYILPGLQMMCESLRIGTGRIRFAQESFSESRLPGISTLEAVQQGAVHSALSLIERSWRDCQSRWKHGVELWLTGGNGLLLQRGLLQQELPLKGRYEEALVMDGLQYAAFSTKTC